MDFNKIDVDKKVLLDCIKNSDLGVNDLICYSNLYQNYNLD